MSKKLVWIEWIEPFIDDEAVYCRVTKETAIKYQKKVALSHSYTYKSDKDALEDFLTIHWANIIT
jgi:hypothetical protein